MRSFLRGTCFIWDCYLVDPMVKYLFQPSFKLYLSCYSLKMRALSKLLKWNSSNPLTFRLFPSKSNQLRKKYKRENSQIS